MNFRGWFDALFERRKTPTGIPNGRRWIVVDVETTGLDRQSDELLSIGAVALQDGQVAVGDSFEMFLKPKQTSSHANILIHGITGEQQSLATDPRFACEQFLDYVAHSPLIGFQAAFDRGFLARAMKTWAQVPLTSPWLDAAELARMAFPQIKARALDEWLEALEITNEQRHSASFDALATAMLFQKVLHQFEPEQRTFRRLQALAAQASFLP